MNAVPTDFTGMTARVVCPFCSFERRKSRLKEMTLSRQSDGAVLYYCHHCEANGSIQPEKRMTSVSMSAAPKVVPVPQIVQQALNEAQYEYLLARGISRATADQAQLFSSRKWFRRLDAEKECIGFPYFRNGALVSAKYRAFPDKDFTQDAGGAHDFWGIDNIQPDLPIIIVEGEIDALSAMEAGLKNILSVPGGAPMKVAEGKASAEEDKRFGFVWNARDILEAAPYIVLATDQDGPGQALMEELARRIGKEKCRIAAFDAKDLNEVLCDTNRINAKKDIEDIIQAATPYPIAGLSDASTYQQRLEDLYNRGEGRGISTGFQNVDHIYTVAPGQLTVVTGYPSSGKSNFVDQLMVNLAKSHAWKFAIASFENQPEVHIMRLMEIFSGRRFHSGTNRMTTKERDAAFAFVQEHFLFIESGGEEPNTLESILGRARAAVKRIGIRGLVIDPYNYIDLNRTGTETEAISDMLTRVKKFCSANDVHTWFVAHPSKIQRSGTDQPRPDGMSISGSMAWWAKTDVGLTVHRKDSNVEIAVWKCRYRWVGRQGETSLAFEPSSGTYHTIDDAF